MAILDEIATAGQIAAALEVCGSPKPGNVHRNADFPGTTFEQFITGSIALGPTLRLAAKRGWMAGRGKIRPSEVRLGRLMAGNVRSVSLWQMGGNTHLGIIMLFTPLAASAGFQAASGERVVDGLRSGVAKLLESSTVEDSVELYAMLRRVRSTWLGELNLQQKAPDVRDPEAAVKLMAENWTLLKVMEACRGWDAVAAELSSSMKMTFELGLPTFKTLYEKTSNLNATIVHTFLTILSSQPDTFIARKVGALKERNAQAMVNEGTMRAKAVSQRAGIILKLGGMLTKEGRNELLRMDEELRNFRGLLNPGSSADVTASSIYVALLQGFRP